MLLDSPDLLLMSDEHANVEPPAPAAPHFPVSEVPPESAAAVPPEAPDAAPPETLAEGEVAAEPVVEENKKRWYIVKIQSGREDTIKNAVERRVRIEGLEEFFGQILIPTENVVEMRDGKRKVKKQKLYPGYLMTEVEYNDRILYLFRETSGVGDFVGGGVDKNGVNKAPTPMPEHEIQRMLRTKEEKEDQPGKVLPVKPPVDRGDRVRVKDGAFAGMEGEVKEILEAKGQIRVELTIFGRPVPIELEYWAVDRV